MLGAIVKAGAKSLAKDKAKSFITGKKKEKGGALQKTVDENVIELIKKSLKFVLKNILKKKPEIKINLIRK